MGWEKLFSIEALERQFDAYFGICGLTKSGGWNYGGCRGEGRYGARKLEASLRLVNQKWGAFYQFRLRLATASAVRFRIADHRPFFPASFFLRRKFGETQRVGPRLYRLCSNPAWFSTFWGQPGAAASVGRLFSPDKFLFAQLLQSDDGIIEVEFRSKGTLDGLDRQAERGLSWLEDLQTLVDAAEAADRQKREEQTAQALRCSVARLYDIFKDYPLRPGLTEERSSPALGNVAENTTALYRKPLSELTVEDLSYFGFKVLTTVGDLKDFKHFLPRLLELAYLALDDWLDYYGSGFTVVQKLLYGRCESWPEAERIALRDYFQSLLAFHHEAFATRHSDERQECDRLLASLR